MPQQLVHTLMIYAAIFLVYMLILLLLYPFAKVASYEPYPQPSTTTRVALTISTRIPLAAYPNTSAEKSITQTFVFGGELAKTVTDFLSDFKSPSLFDLENFPIQADDLVAALIITTPNTNEIRQLTILGPNADKVLSYLAYCFKYQLESGSKELSNDPSSFTL